MTYQHIFMDEMCTEGALEIVVYSKKVSYESLGKFRCSVARFLIFCPGGHAI